MTLYKKARLVPLKKQLLLIIVLFLTGLLLVTFITCDYYTRLHTRVLKNSTDLNVSQLSISVTEIYQTCNSIASSISYNYAIQEYLSADDASEEYAYYSIAYNQVTSMMGMSSYISDIAVIGASGPSIVVNGSLETYGKLADNIQTLSRSLSSCGCATILGSKCHILVMPVYDLNNVSTVQIGYLFVAVDVQSLLTDNPVNDIDYLADTLLVDSRQNVIYGDSSLYSSILPADGESTIKSGNTKLLVTQYPIEATDAVFYVLINLSQIEKEGRQIAVIQCICMAALFLVLSILVMCFYLPLIRSLQKLTDFMKKASLSKGANYRNGITVSQGLLGSTEIQDITDALNYMLAHIYQLNRTIFDNHTRIYEMELHNKKTEIAFLRSQINPHFLYNTLTMICGMASAGMMQEVIDTVSALSHIFRYSIKGEEMVPLSEELEISHAYLEIQQYRFEDRFQVIYKIPDEALSYMLPKMLLQPIIENAIVHGLEPNPDYGMLEIGVSLCPEEEYFIIWVYDTGIGMSAEKRDSIRSALKSQSVHGSDTVMDSFRDMDSRHHDSIGLFNVNSRLLLYYGPDYSLILDSEENVGTKIQMRIPFSRLSEQKKGE